VVSGRISWKVIGFDEVNAGEKDQRIPDEQGVAVPRQSSPTYETAAALLSSDPPG